MKISVEYKTLTRFLKAARLMEQAISDIPPEDRDRQGHGVRFDSERARAAVKKRWANSSSYRRALKKLGGDAA
jgi:hypothetical protein